MIPDSDEDSCIDIGNPKEQSTVKPREAFQYQSSIKTATNTREQSHSMWETISVTDNLYLIPYTSKYFDSITNVPQNTEVLSSTQ